MYVVFDTMLIFTHIHTW